MFDVRPTSGLYILFLFRKLKYAAVSKATTLLTNIIES